MDAMVSNVAVADEEEFPGALVGLGVLWDASSVGAVLGGVRASIVRTTLLLDEQHAVVCLRL